MVLARFPTPNQGGWGEWLVSQGGSPMPAWGGCSRCGGEGQAVRRDDRAAALAAGHRHEAHHALRLLDELVLFRFQFDGSADGGFQLGVATAGAQQRA